MYQDSTNFFIVKFIEKNRKLIQIHVSSTYSEAAVCSHTRLYALTVQRTYWPEYSVLGVRPNMELGLTQLN